MSNNTNNIQSQNTAATYERLYQVYQNVAALDAPNQFMQLPQEIQNQVYGVVYELAGRPVTNDCWWGGHNAFRDFPRLQQAIQRVAFNSYLALPVEQRNAVSGRIYENSGRPQTNDPQWGQNHANDNVGVLFRSIIEGTRAERNPPRVSMERPNGFSNNDYVDDALLEDIIRNLGQEAPSPTRSSTSTTHNNTNAGLNVASRSEFYADAEDFSLRAVQDMASRMGNFSHSGIQNILSGTQGTSLQNRTFSPENSGFSYADFMGEDDDFEEILRRLGPGETNSTPSNTTISTTSTTTTSTSSTTSTSVEGESNLLIERKRAALDRLGQIMSMGDHPIERFDANPVIMTFDLDAVLAPYAGNLNPSILYDLTDWAGVNDNDKRRDFLNATQRYDGQGGAVQDQMCRTLFSKMFSYFRQKRTESGQSQEALKLQFRSCVDKVIDANRNCVDQMLSQLQEMMLHIVADGYTPTEGDRQLGRMLFRAGHELATYRANLLKQIVARQNPDEHHLVDLERVVMQRVAEGLGMTGEIFNAGARFGNLLGNVENKVNDAADAFWQEYHPLEYITSQIATGDGTMNNLRNEMNMWALVHYGLREEEEETPVDTDMNEILSKNYDPDAYTDFVNGGVWSPAAVFFILEAAGIVQQIR